MAARWPGAAQLRRLPGRSPPAATRQLGLQAACPGWLRAPIIATSSACAQLFALPAAAASPALQPGQWGGWAGWAAWAALAPLAPHSSAASHHPRAPRRLFRNLEEVEKLSELGVLFLLFEMGLELSIDRLRALARFAFGMGTLQMLICTLAFAGLGLPPGGSWFSAVSPQPRHAWEQRPCSPHGPTTGGGLPGRRATRWHTGQELWCRRNAAGEADPEGRHLTRPPPPTRFPRQPTPMNAVLGECAARPGLPGQPAHGGRGGGHRRRPGPVLLGLCAAGAGQTPAVPRPDGRQPSLCLPCLALLPPRWHLFAALQVSPLPVQRAHGVPTWRWRLLACLASPRPACCALHRHPAPRSCCASALSWTPALGRPRWASCCSRTLPPCPSWCCCRSSRATTAVSTARPAQHRLLVLGGLRPRLLRRLHTRTGGGAMHEAPNPHLPPPAPPACSAAGGPGHHLSAAAAGAHCGQDDWRSGCCAAGRPLPHAQASAAGHARAARGGPADGPRWSPAAVLLPYVASTRCPDILQCCSGAQGRPDVRHCFAQWCAH